MSECENHKENTVAATKAAALSFVLCDGAKPLIDAITCALFSSPTNILQECNCSTDHTNRDFKNRH